MLFKNNSTKRRMVWIFCNCGAKRYLLYYTAWENKADFLRVTVTAEFWLFNKMFTMPVASITWHNTIIIIFWLLKNSFQFSTHYLCPIARPGLDPRMRGFVPSWRPKVGRQASQTFENIIMIFIRLLVPMFSFTAKHIKFVKLVIFRFQNFEKYPKVPTKNLNTRFWWQFDVRLRNSESMAVLGTITSHLG